MLARLTAGATLSLRSPHITESFCTDAYKMYTLLHNITINQDNDMAITCMALLASASLKKVTNP
jgi:hypothetical protein